MSLMHRYWLGPGTPERGVALRVAFFLVLALDQWMQLAHLARYGAGNFNVSHLDAFDGLIPAPEREWMVALVLVQVVLAVRCAWGIQLRVGVPVLAGLYGVTYFWSQLDSYQHHYLIFVLLAVFAGAVLVEGGDDLPHWSLRLLRWVLAIMYLYAGVAKMDPSWIDGSTLNSALTSDWGREQVHAVASGLEVAPLEVLAWGAIAALVLEVLLPVLLLWPRARTLGWVLGLLFHVSVEVLEFRIGLFSYFMVALYLLFAPRALVVWLVQRARSILPEAGEPQLAPTLVSAGAVGLAVASLPLASAPVAALVAAGLFAWPRLPWRSAVAQGLAAVFVLGVHASSDTLRDYYKYWGGDTRRRGPLSEAIVAYEHVVELDPEYVTGHVRLGDLYLRAERPEEARAAYEEALAIEPDNATARQRLEGLAGLP